jgi:signal transduction histidine kinase
MDFRRRVQVIALTLLMALLLPSWIPLEAQFDRLYEDWRWVHFDVASGLPAPSVDDIFETSDGRVWVLTPNGFAWFDGYQWIPVHCPEFLPRNYDLPGVVVRGECLVITGTGKDTLIAFNAGGCGRVLFPHRSSGMGHLQGLALEGIVLRVDTTMMIIRGDSLVKLASPLDQMKDLNKAKAEGQWGFITYSEKPWLKIRNILYRWTGSDWKEMLRSPGGYLRVELVETDKFDNGVGIFEDQPGVVSVYRWGAQSAAQRYPQEEGDLVKSAAIAPTGEVLTLRTTGALRIRRKSVWSPLPQLPPFVANPTKIRIRNNGDVWVGTQNGLFLCRMSSERWIHWKPGPSNRENYINEILPIPDGSFWVGTRDGVQIREKDEHLRWVKSIHGMPLGRVTGIGRDQVGNIWISSGASFSGAYRWNGNAWRHFGAPEGLTAGRVHKIVSDRQKRLWCLGIAKGAVQENLANEPGPFVFDGSRFARWEQSKGLLDGRVYAMVQDRNGAFWFGTYTGLNRWRDGRWKHWQERDGLRNARVFALAEDSSGRIWFAHNWQGVGYVDERDSIHYLTTDDGLVNDQVWGLTVGPEGRLWVATMNGLGSYFKGEWLAFDVHSGLPHAQLWPVVTSGGKVYAGTQGGGVAILTYQPEDIPDARIEFDRPFERRGITNVRWTAHSFWAEIPSAEIPTRSRVDQRPWSKWSTDRVRELVDESPGDHVIEVQSQSAFGKIGNSVAALELEVPAPVYLRPIFFGPIGLLLFLLVGVTANHFRRKRRFEAVLRDNEHRFRAQYQSNPVPTFTWQKKDDHFILADCNTVARELFGGVFVSWVGLPMKQLASNVPNLIDLADRCYREQTSVRGETIFPLPNGGGSAIMDISMAYVPPDMLLVHARNITQERASAQQIEESREQLRALAARLESVREEERKDLSREIHDELGQAMTGLKMDLAWIRRRLAEGRSNAGEVVGDRLTQMGNLLDESIHSVRRLAGNLRPVMLDDLGLAAAIEWQAKEFQQRTGITTLADILFEESTLSKDISLEVYRIFQEILTNIARHAGATKVQIHLEARENDLVLEVTDNGCGIATDARQKAMGLGILGMEERARRAGGNISIQSASGKGTAVRVSIPIKES